MQTFSILVAALASAPTVFGHMDLSWPPAYRASNNPNAVQSQIDYSRTSPLSSESQFPCKGYIVSQTTAGGASTVTWSTGGSYNFTVEGGATHEGGSCQASLSYDQGKTFTVIHSYMGNCPLSSGESFNFAVPSDAPTGAAVFSWSWLNKVGNREFYQDCSAVTIAGGAGATKPDVAFSSRPSIFVANIGNGCTSIEGTDLVFPEPGPATDVTGAGSSGVTITGTCAAVDGNGGGGGSSVVPVASGVSSAPPSAPETSAASPESTSATSDSPGGVFITSSVAAVPSSAPSSSTAPGSLIPTVDGQCSGTQTCAGQTLYGPCCSQWGWCGNTTAHCLPAQNCQAAFGVCVVPGPASNTLSSAAVASGAAATTSVVQLSLTSMVTAAAALVTTVTAMTTVVETMVAVFASSSASNEPAGFVGITSLKSGFVTSTRPAY